MSGTPDEVQQLLDAAPLDDVLDQLALLAGRTVAWVEVCARRVAALGDAIRYTADGPGTEQLRSEVPMFMSAVAECRQTLAAIARLDIDTRLARLTEQQVEIVMAALDAGLAEAGVAEAVAANARALAARQLQAS